MEIHLLVVSSSAPNSLPKGLSNHSEDVTGFMLTWQTIMIWLAALGALDAFYIACARQYPKLFGRFSRSRCETVLGSKWGAVVYFRNETIGLVFYLGLIALVLAPYVVPQFAPLVFLFILGLVLMAFIFSAWLLYLQALVLRKWCFWCLLALSVNFLIFAAEISLFWG